MTGTERLLAASFNDRGARGPDYHGNFAICCPFCEERYGSPDEDYKLSANPARVDPDDPSKGPGAWHCWRCDAAGWGNLGFLGEPDAFAEPAKVEAAYLGPPDGFVPFEGNQGSLVLRQYLRYAERRGVLGELLKVGAGCATQGKFSGRLVVPHVVTGEWQGFSARAVVEGLKPKYLYPEGMVRGSALWGLEWAPADGQPLWVVEGVFDALPLFPYGVATFGKNIAPDQFYGLLALRRPLVWCLDGDAWQEAKALARRARAAGYAPMAYCHLPPQKDPGTLGWHVREHVICEPGDKAIFDPPTGA